MQEVWRFNGVLHYATKHLDKPVPGPLVVDMEAAGARSKSGAKLQDRWKYFQQVHAPAAPAPAAAAAAAAPVAGGRAAPPQLPAFSHHDPGFKLWFTSAAAGIIEARNLTVEDAWPGQGLM